MRSAENCLNLTTIAPEDSHDHISSIAISGTGPSRLVRIGFETRPDGQHPEYPTCTDVEAKLVHLYGKPRIRRFTEEASRRADRLWRSRTEELTLICFDFRGEGRFFAEAVLITPR